KPEELFANLRKPKPEMNMASGGMNMPSMPNMNMGNMPNMTMSGSSMPGMAMSKADLNDITYDAFLANDRTLADPHVIDVGRNAQAAAPAVGLEQEMQIRGAEPLPTRAADHSGPVELPGDMTSSVWGLQVHGQGGAPITVRRGERVELVMRNTPMMSHPMHL